MGCNKKSFVLYTDYREQISLLSDEEAGRLFKGIFEYIDNGAIPNFSGNLGLKIAFSFVRANLDRDIAKYEQTRKERAAAGREGGTKSGETRRQAKQNKANEAND
jgi:hypothetical protein